METQISDTYLETAIHGPFCPDCQRDISRKISERKTVCSCSKQFSIKEIGTLRYPILSLKRKVYAEAQAAVRRKELIPA